MSEGNQSSRVAELRARLQEARGPEYWRCLEELAATPEFQRQLRQTLPQAATAAQEGVNRRDFLRLMGASMALAGVTACTKQPPEKIIPYVKQPEQLVLGKPLYFATAMPFNGTGIGLLVESHEGRPTKIEGNPNHPASLGATDLFAQASVLGLYDPDRSQTVTYQGEIRPWGAFLNEMRSALSAVEVQQGNGLRFLTGSIASPTLADQMQRIVAALPGARWHQYEPINRDGTRVGATQALGADVEPVYHLEQADVIVSLDADFLSCGPGSARYLRDFSDRRRLAGGQTTMNRLYVVEGVVSNTGDKADHRLALRPTEIPSFAMKLAAAVGLAGVPQPQQPSGGEADRWIAAVAKDLKAHAGRSLVIAGDHQPAAVHAVAHAMNAALGNIGKTVSYLDPLPGTVADQMSSLRDLVADMQAGRVLTLVMIDVNPVYDAPRDLRFADALAKVRLRVHAGLYRDETAAMCHWHVPDAHYLESWSDARAFDGTVSIVQPLIAPLYNSKSVHEVVAAFSQSPEQTGYDIVRAFWKGRANQPGDAEFEAWWRHVLNDGVIPNSAPPPKSVTARAGGLSGAQAAQPPGPGPDIVFRPDPTIWDGRFANNAWLQELPKPVLRIDWDNVAAVSPALAARLKIDSRNVVELKHGGGTVEAPVWVVPGLADNTVVVYLGYGRTRAGHLGSNIGFDAYALRRSDAPWFGSGLQVQNTGRTAVIAEVQQHQLMEGRHLVRAGTLEEYAKHPKFAQEEVETTSLSLYPEYKYEGYKWGMSIDLNACTGCSACVVACYAENNIPVVGKDQVTRGRIMHWLRIDRYHKGTMDSPEVYHQPVPCMHCENAPCELVCPVGATVHSPEGLNDMVYNRCVGTRYCSNNCPYKVRRFNFLLFSDWETPSLKAQRNPDVTVRSRGVMEKCTYCVQRINEAKIEAEKENRAVHDGEILTACQAACPANAIVFGDINDKNAGVAKLKNEPRNYALLGDLNTRPRTTYLAAVRNPNPELEG